MPANHVTNLNEETFQDWYNALQEVLNAEGISVGDSDNWHRIQIVNKDGQTPERFSRSENDTDVTIAQRLATKLMNGDEIYVFGSNGTKAMKLDDNLDPVLGAAPEDPGPAPNRAPAPTRWQRFVNKITFGRAYKNVFSNYEQSEIANQEYAAKQEKYDMFSHAVRDYRNGELDVQERRLDRRLGMDRTDVSKEFTNTWQSKSAAHRVSDNTMNREPQMFSSKK